MAEPVPIWHEGDQAEQTSAFDLSPWSAVMPELAESAARLLAMPDVTGVAIAHEDPVRNAMVCVLSCGRSAPSEGTLLDVTSGISGRCVRESQMLHSYDALIDPRVNRRACEELGIRSLAIAPLQRNSRCIGVLEVLSEQPGTFEAEARNRVQQEATLVAALLDPGHELNDLGPAELRGPDEGKLVDAADDSSLSEPSSDFTMVPKGEGSSGIAEPLSIAPLLSPATLRNHRLRRRNASLVVIALVTISALLFIHNADHKLNRERVADPPAIVETSGPARVIAQPSTLPAKSSEQEIANAISSPLRKLMESAASGDVKAQISLADRYARGDGLRADKVKAAAWYIIAGAHGNERAKAQSVLITHQLPQFEIGEIRFNVGKMYSDGIGGQRDLVAAYSWFALAQAAGDVRAHSEQEKLEHIMTDAQVSEAFHRASGWLASHRTRLHSRDTIAAYASKSP
jgi:hypothetical protein